MSKPSTCTADMPRPYNLELEIHKACRDGNLQQMTKLLFKKPSLVDVRDEKVLVYPQLIFELPK